MIITCNNCQKNFDIDQSVIPEKGRLLQCNSCNHKWFFKKDIIIETIPKVENNELANVEATKEQPEATKEQPEPIKEQPEATKEQPEATKEQPEATKEQPVSFITENSETIELLDKSITNDSAVDNFLINDEDQKNEVNNQKIKLSKTKKKINILGLIIVFITSFVALIIVLDTFQVPLSKLVPNIEFLLYSLYETINDIVLFFRNLI